MADLHDLNKAKEQKQKRIETKEKHSSAYKADTVDYKAIVADIISDKIKEVEEVKLFGSNKINELKEFTEKILAQHHTQNHFIYLAEHFIIHNGLEDEFIDFIKGKSESEPIKEYREAAVWKDSFYRTRIEGCDEIIGIDDKYTWAKEEMEENN